MSVDADRWVLCKVAAKDATAEWRRDQRRAIVAILRNGDVLVRYRASELVRVPS